MFNTREFWIFLKLFDVIQYFQFIFLYAKSVISFVKVLFPQPEPVILIRSTPDLLTLYYRPLPIKIKTYAVQPTTRCIPAQHTTSGERDHPRPFYNRLKKYPVLHNLSDRTQPTPYISDHYALPRSRSAHCRSVNFSRAAESGG